MFVVSCEMRLAVRLDSKFVRTRNLFANAHPAIVQRSMRRLANSNTNPKDQLGVTIVLGARIIQPFLPPCRTFLIERTGCRAGQRALSANSVLPGPYWFALLIMSIGLAVVGIALSLSQGTGIPEVDVSA